MHFQQILRQTEFKRLKFCSRWSKVPRVLGHPNRALAILVIRSPRPGEVFKPKNTPKMAINRDFSGLRAFSANFATGRIEEVEIFQPMVKSAARFGAPKPSYGRFSHPAGHGRGRFLSQKTPKMAINRYFPGLRAFSANFATHRIEEDEIPQPMVKSAARFRAPKPSHGHFSHPAMAGGGF